MTTLSGGRPLTSPELITQLEGQLGITFPKAYVELVSSHDGASVENGICLFDDPVLGRLNATSLDALSPFSPDASSNMTMACSAGLATQYGHSLIVEFGVEGGGCFFAFDYRGDPATTNPPVIVWVCNTLLGDCIVRVGDSFEGFMAALVTEEEAQIAYRAAYEAADIS